MLTRASSRNPRSSPKKPTIPSMLNPTDDEVIIISDDERPIRATSGGTSKARNKRKALPSCIIGDEVLEIMSSSDEDEARRSRPPAKKSAADTNSEVTALQKKLKLVQTDAKKELDAALDRADVIGRDFVRVVEENRQLKDSMRSNKTRLVLDASQLEDNISCEICTTKMWTPYILPECGHVFCQSCLTDWFSTTLSQHLAHHPNYILNPPLPQHLRHIALQVRSNPNNLQLRSQLEALTMQHRAVTFGPRPAYTCPTCREEVKNRPVEDFALKSVVRTLAMAMGENSPVKKGNGHIGGNGRSGPWDGFFSTGFML